MPQSRPPGARPPRPSPRLPPPHRPRRWPTRSPTIPLGAIAADCTTAAAAAADDLYATLSSAAVAGAPPSAFVAAAAATAAVATAAATAAASSAAELASPLPPPSSVRPLQAQDVPHRRFRGFRRRPSTQISIGEDRITRPMCTSSARCAAARRNRLNDLLLRCTSVEGDRGGGSRRRTPVKSRMDTIPYAVIPAAQAPTVTATSATRIKRPMPNIVTALDDTRESQLDPGRRANGSQRATTSAKMMTTQRGEIGVTADSIRLTPVWHRSFVAVAAYIQATSVPGYTKGPCSTQQAEGARRRGC